MTSFSSLVSAAKACEATYDMRSSTRNLIVLAPVAILVIFAAFLILPATRKATLWLLDENHPVEHLTFVLALAGGVWGLALAWRARRHGENPIVLGFYALFSVALILVGMEEIAWGQQLLRFETPADWQAINLQGETTLHNLAGVHGHSEVLRLAFGLGGLAGVALSLTVRFRKIGAPPILLLWFAAISAHAALDVYNDAFPIEQRLDFYVQRTSELVELLITASGLLYVLLNSRMLEVQWRRSGAA